MVYKYINIVEGVFYKKNSKNQLVMFKGNCSKKVSVPFGVQVYLDYNRKVLILEQFENNKHLFFYFCKNLSLSLISLKKKFRVQVLLKGVGIRINYNSQSKFLSFFFGYSHVINVRIPCGIFCETSNQKVITSITLVSFDKVKLIWFAHSLKRFKSLQYYTGKGLVVVCSKEFSRYQTLKKVR